MPLTGFPDPCEGPLTPMIPQGTRHGWAFLEGSSRIAGRHGEREGYSETRARSWKIPSRVGPTVRGVW